MTIAEKLIRAKSDYDQVYAAGKKSMTDESKVIAASISGNFISVNDVSEVPHDVICKIRGVDNPESVTVTRTGKNLATAQQVFVGAGDYAEMVEDNRNVIRFQSHTSVLKNLPIFEENTQYTFSFDAKSVLRHSMHEGKTDLILIVHYTDGTRTGVFCKNDEPWTKRTLVTTAGKTVESVGHDSYGYYNYIYVDIDTFQVEKGNVATEYEPYTAEFFAPTTNGMVESLTSISPHMNIFTDTAEASIDVTYNKSWGMHEAGERFCDAFKLETINNSINLEKLSLSKDGIKSIVNRFSSSVTGKTATFKKTSIESVFTNAEWADLTATKPNWFFSLV